VSNYAIIFNMRSRYRKKMRIIWIIISVLAVLSMIAFTVAPMMSMY